MNYLLDTNVLSELRRKPADANVVAWLGERQETSLFVSVIAFGEIRKGIAKLKDAERRAKLTTWLDNELSERFSGRLLAVDGETALIWGELLGEAERNGEPLPVVDTLLAATALKHGLTLVTRNVQDFGRYPLTVLNPWITLP